MKNQYVLAFLISCSSGVAIACPSVDQAVSDFENGVGTASEVAEAIKCQVQSSAASNLLCHTTVGANKDIVRQIEAEVAIGESSLPALADAKRELAEAEAACSK